MILNTLYNDEGNISNNFSVFMPVYNGSEFLYKSIESVLNQTFNDFELVCVDDSSTDNSYEIDEEKVGYYFPLRNFTYKNIEQVFTISEIGANIIKRRYPNFSEKIYVKRLGVLPIKKNQNRLEKKVIQVVSCSGIRPEKRVQLIFSSLNEYCKKYPNIKVIWSHIGADMGYDNSKKQTIVKEHNLHDNLLGSLENYEVLNYYKNNS